VALHKRHAARCQNGLDQLLDGLLCVEADNGVGDVGIW
jgi:hypothetical protein